MQADRVELRFRCNWLIPNLFETKPALNRLPERHDRGVLRQCRGHPFRRPPAPQPFAATQANAFGGRSERVFGHRVKVA